MDENESMIADETAAFDEDWEASPGDADDDMDLSADGESGAAEPEDEAAENQRSWILKHNGAEVAADEAKMVELAQKGLDYDRVRGERDSFKAEHPRYAAYESFLAELAASAGTDVDGLIHNVRAGMQARQPAAETDPARKTANLKAFLAAYPGVKAEDVPIEVLREGFARGDLAGAYARHENRQLREELETLRQTQKNKERSTGSRTSTGDASPQDDFDAVWDSN